MTLNEFLVSKIGKVIRLKLASGDKGDGIIREVNDGYIVFEDKDEKRKYYIFINSIEFIRPAK